jgi:hypothetical protein
MIGRRLGQRSPHSFHGCLATEHWRYGSPQNGEFAIRHSLPPPQHARGSRSHWHPAVVPPNRPSMGWSCGSGHHRFPPGGLLPKSTVDLVTVDSRDTMRMANSTKPLTSCLSMLRADQFSFNASWSLCFGTSPRRFRENIPRSASKAHFHSPCRHSFYVEVSNGQRTLVFEFDDEL